VVTVLDKILLVTRNTKSKDALLKYLINDLNRTVEVADSVESGKLKLAETTFDLIIVNYPLDSHTDASFSIYCAQSTSAGVIALLKSKEIDALSERLEKYGIIVINKPILKVVLNQAIKFAELSKNRVLTLNEENLKLQDKIVQIKLVNRAKWVLIRYLNMTENQAHKYIEQQAMERRVSKKKIAEKILKMYEH
jgi:response regulator NasT